MSVEEYPQSFEDGLIKKLRQENIKLRKAIEEHRHQMYGNVHLPVFQDTDARLYEALQE